MAAYCLHPSAFRLAVSPRLRVPASFRPEVFLVLSSWCLVETVACCQLLATFLLDSY